MHSFGGVYGGGAINGISKSECQEEGRIGGVVALIYMAAPSVPSAMTTLVHMRVGADLLPWTEIDVRNDNLRANLSLLSSIPYYLSCLQNSTLTIIGRRSRQMGGQPETSGHLALVTDIKYAPFKGGA